MTSALKRIALYYENIHVVMGPPRSRRLASGLGPQPNTLPLWALALLAALLVCFVTVMMVLGQYDPDQEAHTRLSNTLAYARTHGDALKAAHPLIVKSLNNTHISELQHPMGPRFTLEDLDWTTRVGKGGNTTEVAYIPLGFLPKLLAGERRRGFCNFYIEVSAVVGQRKGYTCNFRVC